MIRKNKFERYFRKSVDKVQWMIMKDKEQVNVKDDSCFYSRSSVGWYFHALIQRVKRTDLDCKEEKTMTSEKKRDETVDKINVKPGRLALAIKPGSHRKEIWIKFFIQWLIRKFDCRFSWKCGPRIPYSCAIILVNIF